MPALAGAQTFSEWFRQKKTQKKYLIQQIAALEVYKDFLKKGYKVVKDGTGLIGDITGGEFNLHADYFGSLKSVNPDIREQSRADDMVKLRQEMLRDKDRIEKLLETKSFIAPDERTRYNSWYESIGKEADSDLEELKLLLEDGKLELDDAARISRIDKLYKDMQTRYTAQRKFSARLLQMVRAREQSLKDAELLRKMHGLAP